MDGFRERMASRSEHANADRASDRYDRMARRSAGSPSSDGLKIEEITGAMDASNAKQLEIIADYFDDEKDSRQAGEAEILRALDELLRMGNDTGLRSPAGESVAHAAPVKAASGMDPMSKQEIINAIKGNGALLGNLKQELAALIEEQNIRAARMNEARDAKEAADRDARNKKDQLEREAREARERAEREARDARELEQREAREAREKATLEALEAALQNNQGITPEQLEEIKKIVADSVVALEDHVHKENVKCYRNVQAALTEQNDGTIGSVNKSLSMTKVFVIITMALSLLNLALTAASVLNLF